MSLAQLAESLGFRLKFHLISKEMSGNLFSMNGVLDFLDVHGNGHSAKGRSSASYYPNTDDPASTLDVKESMLNNGLKNPRKRMIQHPPRERFRGSQKRNESAFERF
jgi:hypothetical protein